MTPWEQTGLVAGISAAIYAVAEAIKAGFKKLTGTLEAQRRDARRQRDDDQVSAQFAEIQRELKTISVSMAKADVKYSDVLRRLDELERKMDKWQTQRISPRHESGA